MPPENPLTRLSQVSLGLGALADTLQEETGVDPINVRYWSLELRDIIVEIERQYQMKPLERDE